MHEGGGSKTLPSVKQIAMSVAVILSQNITQNRRSRLSIADRGTSHTLLHLATVVQAGYTGWSGMVFIEPIPQALLTLTMLPVVL